MDRVARWDPRSALPQHGTLFADQRSAMFAIKKILYPTDFSSYSNQAYFHAVALAETHGASLTILYVFNPAWEDHDESDIGADKEYWQGQLEQIRPTNPAIQVEHVLVQGDPGVEIPQFATKGGFDMVVM